MIPTLPQIDSAEQRQARQRQLERQRQLYRYTYMSVDAGGSVPPIPLVASLPLEENFPPEHVARLLQLGLRLIGNSLLLEARGLLPRHVRLEGLRPRSLLSLGAPLDPTELLRKVSDLSSRLNDIAPTPARSLEQYDELDSLLPSQPAATYRQDLAFARARTSGVNPLMLRRVDELPPRFPLTPEVFQQVVGEGDTLSAAMAQGRLFMADYSLLEGLSPGTTVGGRRKYLCAPRALFCWRHTASGGELVPVAIQLEQSPTAPLFTPAHGTTWLVARTFVQVADGNVHEMFSHLGRTHLVLEPFAISTARQLSRSHPVAVLLAPHLQATLAINWAARNFLIAPDGGVERLLAGTLQSSLTLAARARALPFREQALPRELASRGLEDPSVPPDYPYREDALLLWAAIKDFVTDYLSLYYPTDAEVVSDVELQAWARELQAEDGGQVRGLTANGKLETVRALSGVLTQVLFTAGPQHSAVNFSQYPEMGYAPNQPLAAYRPPPQDVSPLPPEALLDWMPPLDQAYRQVELLYVLSSARYGEFGKYDFEDGHARELAARFRRRLADIESTIDERNLQRLTPYPYLKPSLIPSSINI